MAQELAVLLAGTEPHHLLHSSPVVPRAIEKHDLSSSWKVGDIAMEVPLTTLCLCWLGQRDDASCPRIEVFHEPLDRAALAGRIAAFEQDHMLRARFL